MSEPALWGPTRNRFLLFPNYLGSPQPKKDGWQWTVLYYPADGPEWFFAKDRGLSINRDGS